MCLNPKWIYKKGKYKKSNYHGEEGSIYELGTYSKCGNCEICQNEKSNNWMIRNYYESKKDEPKAFITLTYRDNPIILHKKDLQNFIKRLRRYLEYHGYKKKLRFFGAGEYGTLKGRPHFHVIIYGWNDIKKEYLDISKRINIVYRSEIIEKVWGLGRTSIQEFASHEIPYISLYETPKEKFSKAYKLTREKLKKIEKLYRNYKITGKRRLDLLNGLKEYQKKFEDEKTKYQLIREFNTWSIALGWSEFEKEYIKAKKYVFEEYIENKTFITPSPWVKKLANQGDVQAIAEMLKREKEIKKNTLKEEKIKNHLKVIERKKTEKLDWLKQKNEITSTL